jgi:hypothetical protein
MALSRSVNRPTGEDGAEVGSQLVAQRHPVGDQVLSGPDGGPQRGGRRDVRDQRAQPVGLRPILVVGGGARPLATGRWVPG